MSGGRQTDRQTYHSVISWTFVVKNILRHSLYVSKCWTTIKIITAEDNTKKTNKKTSTTATAASNANAAAANANNNNYYYFGLVHVSNDSFSVFRKPIPPVVSEHCRAFNSFNIKFPDSFCWLKYLL